MILPLLPAPAVLCAVVALLGTEVCAQQLRVTVQPVGAIETPQDAADEKGDRGVPVELFESPNLDRFVRRARQFLTEERFADAIAVLQSVVEGRTLEAMPLGPDETETELAPTQAGGAQADGAHANGTEPQKQPAEGEATPVPPPPPTDPRQAVFSADGRVYRPAGRLCQEYLAAMPAPGIELYQGLFEAAAADQLAAAVAGGGLRDLEQVALRYFPTLAAGTALQTLADRHLHAGQYRAAVQVLRDLVELYPRDNLKQLGISVLWCRFKMALCLRLSGEVSAANDAARAIAADFPDESLRLMGELLPVSELPAHPMFALGEQQRPVATSPTDARIEWLTKT
ncbi:MAG: tetratricopeptide repeat protein, partial [Planctomycetota bacterium]